MRPSSRPLPLLALLAPAFAQSPNHFTLSIHGKEIGEADYTVSLKHQIHSAYSFKLPNVAEFAVEQTADYDAKWLFTGATLSATINGNTQPSVTVLTDIGGKRVTFRARFGEATAPFSSYDLKPHPVLLNDFDPSGIEALLHLAQSAESTAPFPFQAIVIKAKGMVGEGTLRF